MAQPLLWLWRQKKDSSKSGQARRHRQGALGEALKPEAEGGSFGGTGSPEVVEGQQGWAAGNAPD